MQSRSYAAVTFAGIFPQTSLLSYLRGSFKFFSFAWNIKRACLEWKSGAVEVHDWDVTSRKLGWEARRLKNLKGFLFPITGA